MGRKFKKANKTKMIAHGKSQPAKKPFAKKIKGNENKRNSRTFAK